VNCRLDETTPDGVMVGYTSEDMTEVRVQRLGD
jgi:hypothetical protein